MSARSLIGREALVQLAAYAPLVRVLVVHPSGGRASVSALCALSIEGEAWL